MEQEEIESWLTIKVERQEELKTKIMEASKVEIVVVDQISYAEANKEIGRLQSFRKEVVSRFVDPKKRAAEAHKFFCELEKFFLSPLDEKIRVLKGSTTAWYAAEQRRIEAEEERRRRDAEEMAALAAEAESNGDTEIANEAVVAAAMEQAAVTVTPKVKGTSMREVWHAEVVDMSALPKEYMIVNQSLLDKMAQASKGMIPIPGVKFVKSYINSTRAK